MHPLLKMALFALDPETAHNFAKSVACLLPTHAMARHYRVDSENLKTTWKGISFSNPVGLAAGFDKDAKAARLVEALGFGFAELGSVSYYPCRGNPRPRVFRLKKDEALINWMGLPNPGITAFLDTLKHSAWTIPVGLSLVKTPEFAYNTGDWAPKNGIEDFVDSFAQGHDRVQYVCLNLSCPNAKDGKSFEVPGAFQELAAEISLTRTSLNSTTPLLLKISPDLNAKDLYKIVDCALKYDFDGFVVGNTTTTRPHLRSSLTREQKNRGGLSGKPLLELANHQLKTVTNIVGQKKVIFGVGGVHDLNALLAKLSAGATFVQVYTGLIYSGPSFVKTLNQGLAKFCEQQGLRHYSELIGQPLG